MLAAALDLHLAQAIASQAHPEEILSGFHPSFAAEMHSQLQLPAFSKSIPEAEASQIYWSHLL